MALAIGPVSGWRGDAPVGASAGRHDCPGGQAWEEAIDRGTPTLVTSGGAMAAAGLQRIGFRAVGRVWHLVDRIDR